ncbi:Hyaluronidase (Fragment) [Seminavis robusta]|uniref:Hyaluronidase n=1 Tax=Seminavis robusta TaxID=568900 RepID=A0A9N8DLH3_9STRA
MPTLVSLLVLSLLVATLAASGEDESGSLSFKRNLNTGSSGVTGFPHRFQPFCNYACHGNDCPDPSQFDFVECNQTQTGNHCSLKGCQKWTQGVFPFLHPVKEQHTNTDATDSNSKDWPIWTSKETGKRYYVINGGAPQLANLTLHLETLHNTIDQFIPNKNYGGNLVLDFEPWSPIWEQNMQSIAGFHSKVTQEYSLQQMQQAHPTWSHETVQHKTVTIFTHAAIQFMVQTLQTLRLLRPYARIGFYGFPGNHYGHCDDNNERCGYSHPHWGPILRAQNDRIQLLYQTSSALFPSVYLSSNLHNQERYDVWRVYNQIMTKDTVTEAIRLVVTQTTRPSSQIIPIIPFFWAYYHNGTTLLLPDDVTMVVDTIYRPPWATAVIQWGNTPAHWQNTIGGPIFHRKVQQVETCARQYCNDRGWCLAFNHATKDENTADTGLAGQRRPNCICDPGYGGSDCSQTTVEAEASIRALEYSTVQ